MKRCKTYGQDKPLTEFYRDKQNRDGYRAHCKDCWNARVRAHRRDNIDEALRREQARREANRELFRERGRCWAQENKEQQVNYQRAYSADLLGQVLAHYGDRCACCGATEQLTIDHINGDGNEHRIQLFGSGKAAGRQFYRWLIRNGFPEGYQTLCGLCNNSKGRRERCQRHPSDASTKEAC